MDVWIDRCQKKLSYEGIHDWYLVGKRWSFSSRRKSITEEDCLILEGVSSQDLAPAYLIDLKPYCKVFLRVIKISPLRACLVSYWWTNDTVSKKLWKKVGEIKLIDSCTKTSSLRWNKSYNLRIFKSEKIGVNGEVEFLKAIALTTFFCRRYIGLVWMS